jgi:hypothetical protein
VSSDEATFWRMEARQHASPERERELRAQREHKCPRCHIRPLNRCRSEDGTLLEHPHPDRVKLVKEG